MATVAFLAVPGAPCSRASRREEARGAGGRARARSSGSAGAGAAALRELQAQAAPTPEAEWPRRSVTPSGKAERIQPASGTGPAGNSSEVRPGPAA